MAKWILRSGGQIEGKIFFEIETSHDPIVSIEFFLHGAKQEIMVDPQRPTCLVK
jgi:hypothetical protein